MNDDAQRIVRPAARSVGNVSGMVFYGVGINLIQKLGGVVLALILVRVVSKEDYGAFGIASAIVIFLMTFSVERFAESSFFVKDHEDPRFDLHLGFALLLHGVICLVIVGVACGLLFSKTYARSAPLLFFAAFTPLLNAPRIVYTTELSRRLAWRRLRTLGLASFGFASAASLVLAFAGYGGLALMAQTALTPVPFLIDMAYSRRDLFRASFDFSEYRSSFRFGLFRSGSAAVGRGREIVEGLVISGSMGLAGLGVYGRAFGLAQLTTGWLGAQLSTIVYPVLAKFDAATPEHRRASGLLIRLCLWAAAPPTVAIALSENATVSLLYGVRWLDVTPLVHPMLMLVFVATLISALNVVAMTALGVRFVFMNQVATAVIALVALPLVLPTSLTAYVWVNAAGFAVIGVFVLWRLVAVGALDLWDLLRGAAPVTALIAVGFLLRATPAWHAIASMNIWIQVLGLNVASCMLLACAIRLLDVGGLVEASRFLPRSVQSGLRVALRLPPAPPTGVGRPPKSRRGASPTI